MSYHTSCRVTQNLGSWGIKKYYKNIGTGWEHGPVSSLPSRKNFLAIAFKNYTKTDIKVCCSCLIFFHFFNFCQMFSEYKYSTQIFQKNSLTSSVPFPWLSMTFPVQKGKKHHRPFQNYNLLASVKIFWIEFWPHIIWNNLNKEKV